MQQSKLSPSGSDQRNPATLHMTQDHLKHEGFCGKSPTTPGFIFKSPPSIHSHTHPITHMHKSGSCLRRPGVRRWLASWQEPHPRGTLGSSRRAGPRWRAAAVCVCLDCALISVNSDLAGSVAGRRDNGLLWGCALCPCQAKTGRHTHTY